MTINMPHGGNIEETAKNWGCNTSDILDLSTGLHPLGIPKWLPDWLKNNASLIAHYPERFGEPARTSLAKFMRVAPENILITAGAQAAIEILPQALNWKSLAIRQPCYGEPIRAAKRAGCKVTLVNMHEPWPKNTECIWLTNPHNPCGSSENFPHNRHGVLDESYMIFQERKQLQVLPRVIRVGSLTKTFCIPGLRLGYVIAEKKFIHRIQSWLPPWPTSTLAAHLLPKLLSEAIHRDKNTAILRTRMAGLLEQYGWKVKPSMASFVLAKPSGALPSFSEKHILIRQFDEWGSLHHWIRLGFPAHEADWQRLDQVLSFDVGIKKN